MMVSHVIISRRHFFREAEGQEIAGADDPWGTHSLGSPKGLQARRVLEAALAASAEVEPRKPEAMMLPPLPVPPRVALVRGLGYAESLLNYLSSSHGSAAHSSAHIGLGVFCESLSARGGGLPFNPNFGFSSPAPVVGSWQSFCCLLLATNSIWPLVPADICADRAGGDLSNISQASGRNSQD